MFSSCNTFVSLQCRINFQICDIPILGFTAYICSVMEQNYKGTSKAALNLLYQ